MIGLKISASIFTVLAVTGCQVAVTPIAHEPLESRSTVQINVPVKSGGERLIRVHGDTRLTGVSRFLGIPFAEPPTGERRFRYAVHKTFDEERSIEATRFPPACPQDQGNPNWYRRVAENFGASRNVVPDQDNISEDCLYLNVWRPAFATSGHPVMVWFHGGSNINGWSHEPNYRGHELVRRNVVVVSVQSRLGPLGFLPHVLDDEPGGNFALSDQVVALEWIQKHIAAFGGDPENITAFGESAGGGNIAALLTGPAAAGLIDKAIIQSGGAGNFVAISADTASARAHKMFKALSVETAEQARDVHWQEYVAWANANRSDYYHYPVEDGVFVGSPDESEDKAVPLMVGTNRHESLMYLDDTSADPVADAVRYTGASQALVDLVRNYQNRLDWSDLEAADFITGAYDFHCPALELADGAVKQDLPVYHYLFTRERAGDRGIRSYHGAEIPYVFDTHDEWLPMNASDRTLTSTMVSYWTNFARNGDPNENGLPNWKKYTPGQPYTQELGNHVREYDNPFREACHLLRQPAAP